MRNPMRRVRAASMGLACLLGVALAAGGCGNSGGTGGGDDNGGPDPFVFSQSPASAYARVDRVGMPAVATVLIGAPTKDAYNAADPADDDSGTFVPEIVGALFGLHAALNDDLMGAALTPCTVVGNGTGTCETQGLPLVVPDVLELDPGQPAGFPNGRRLEDRVVDLLLAAILLDLGIHPADALATLPLNPPANDLPFGTAFPYLAPAH